MNSNLNNKKSMIPIKQFTRKQPILKENKNNNNIWFAVSSKESIFYKILIY